MKNQTHLRLGIALFTLMVVLSFALQSLLLILSLKHFFTLSCVLLFCVFIFVFSGLVPIADIFAMNDDYGFQANGIWKDVYKSRSLPRMH